MKGRQEFSVTSLLLAAKPSAGFRINVLMGQALTHRGVWGNGIAPRGTGVLGVVLDKK